MKNQKIIQVYPLKYEKECVICFEIVKSLEKRIYCNICKGNFHSNCYKKWLRTKKRRRRKINNNTKCIICQQSNCMEVHNKKKKYFRNFFTSLIRIIFSCNPFNR